VFSRGKAFRADYADTTVAVSHRWEHKDVPDRTGAQARALKEYLVRRPEVTHVWVDWCCLPQGTRTPHEKAEFDRMLAQVNLLYLGCSVLVMIDMTYIGRFWTQFEAWLSMQSPTPEGLKPTEEVGAALRCEVACLHNAKALALDEKLRGMWADKTPGEAYAVLSQPDVVVTNEGDKTTQLRKLEKLDQLVRETLAR